MKVVQFRRKREGKTDYRKRLKMLTTKKLRLVVRPAHKNISAQIISFDPKGDKVLAGVSAQTLTKYGWTTNKGNLPAAYLTGFLLGKRAVQKKLKSAVLDTGMHTPVKGGRIYACAQGVVDAGITLPIDPSVLPTKERIQGQHIASYAQESKIRMSGYQKAGIEPAAITKLFEKVKTAIEAKP